MLVWCAACKTGRFDRQTWTVTPIGEPVCPECVEQITQIEDTRPVVRIAWLAKLGFVLMAAGVLWISVPIPRPFTAAPFALFMVGVLIAYIGGAFQHFSHARQVGERLTRQERRMFTRGRISFRDAEALAGVRPLPLPHDRRQDSGGHS